MSSDNTSLNDKIFDNPEINNFEIDDAALEDAGINVRDLMFYVHTACNLRCDHCYVGDDWLDNAWKFEPEEASAILHNFEEDGLDRLTFLGGEPTLYPHLTDLIKQSQNYEIGERRMTTNGVRMRHFDLNRIEPSDLDHVSFSFDGYTKEMHENIRGEGNFEKAINGLQKLQESGFDTRVTYTVMRPNMYELPEAIDFFGDLGVNEVNFHLMSKIGNAADNQELSVSPGEWLGVRRELEEDYQPPEGTKVRIPLMFATPEEFNEIEDYKPFQEESYHSEEENGQRIVLYPNGKVYMSCDLTGTDYNFAEYDGGEFSLASGQDELNVLEENPDLTDPSSYLLDKQTDGLIPVSISYKETIEG